MVYKITGEQPFQVLSDSFSISPSEQNYIVQVSADGENYSDLFAVSSGTTKMCTGMSNGSYYRLKNNQSEVSVNWRTTCKGGEGGGGSYVLPPATEQTLGGIKVGSGLTVQADGTLSANGGADPEAIQEAIDANNTLIEEGEIIAGMAKQLYSPDGVTSEGAFAYRTTAGDEDVSTGKAELRKIEGNASFPEIEYNDSVVLERNGEPVEGFDADIEWGQAEVWNSVQRLAEFKNTYPNVVKARISITDNSQYIAWSSYGGGTRGVLNYNSGNWTTGTNTQATEDPNVFTWKYIGQANFGTFTIDGDYLVIEITGNTQAVGTIEELDGPNNSTYQIMTSGEIPNDIPVGETTYTYDGSDWSETLPQAITAMTINGVDYVPQSGDELVVTRTLSKTGNASYPAPDSFVALGLNSFTPNSDDIINFIAMEDYDLNVDIDNDDYSVMQNSNYNIYAIKAVTGLENGYIVYHNEGSVISIAGVADAVDWDEITFATTIHTTKYDVVFPTAEFPYIVFSVKKGDETNVCVHPRWSGYMDESYEDYAESVLDISSFNADCPLLSVGNVRNIWDFDNSQLIQNIGVSTYSAQAVQDLIDGGKEIGVDFDFDENNIYEVLDEPIVTDITFDNEYEANDFSVEYFTQDNGLISMPVYATTWYMNNLVDKLRRLNGVVHLDNLNGVGDEDTLYEADEMLWTWSDSDGVVAEWTDNPTTLGNTKGYGLIFSHIPEGQTLLEFKYPYSGNWRKIKMINGTLTLTEADDTVVTSCTIGNKVQFNTTAYSFYWVKVNYKKHWIGFEVSSSVDLQNVWNGTVQGGHFVITDHSNHPWMDISSDYGIPRWNDKGQVIHKEIEIKNKGVKFNTTGYNSAYMLLSSGEGNLPNSIYVPTVGGTAGQILQSNGTEAAPSWTTMIKAQKITSAAYEALVQAGQTDPNTLYLIDDNA